MLNTRYHYNEIKTAIKKQDLADFFTISKYGFSPYRACEHGCRYCDGRAEKYFVEGEFDKDIVIRRNIAELLEQELAKLREKAFISIGSGVSDAYQPVEQDTKIMRQCAEILVRFNFPVVILTKSSLILRDLDLWSQINKKSKFLLMMSITSAHDTYRKIFEPGASSIEQRFETIRQFKAAGCSVGVLAMPLLPYITETESNMGSLADAVKKAGADFCMPGGLTLRPGIQKEIFMNALDNGFCEYKKEYEEIYSENRQSGAPSRNWLKKVQPYYRRMFEISGLPPVVPHAVIRGSVPRYEEIYLVLCLMKVSYEYRFVDTRRLQKATECYRNWVMELRRPVSRSRKRSFSEIDCRLEEVCRSGEIGNLIANGKLGEFIKKIVSGEALFNFGTLQFDE